MTIEEARENIEYMRDNFPYINDEKKQAFDLAIKALNTMPFIHDMNNTIDRLKERIKALEDQHLTKIADKGE